MRYFLLWIAFMYLTSNLSAQQKVLFEVGKKDGGSSEFALAPNHYESFLAGFSGESTYYIGYSSATKHWPYVLPGPLDHWAGGGYWAGYHPRHFPSIYFSVAHLPHQGDCLFSIFFVGVNAGHNTQIRITVNGERFEQTIVGVDKNALLEGKEQFGTQREVKISFPVTLLNQGINRIQIGTVAGSWAVFDAIQLNTPQSVTLTKASSTLIRKVTAASFEYQQVDKGRV